MQKELGVFCKTTSWFLLFRFLLISSGCFLEVILGLDFSTFRNFHDQDTGRRTKEAVRVDWNLASLTKHSVLVAVTEFKSCKTMFLLPDD
ncbi:hypothetical protein F0562_033893 [Nyssa sinensis]|uniref:Uncharacterized protein n=1 Tax=Nyssa sinensis TaxID=561372 RepID=A0A5J5AGK0_9ASTE|nr:hypothetical protein F0562_033893 [Nyssa sinensis]